ncbi:MAG TPA: hypothetical protein VF461_19150 [Gemmatimonadaceae bacterium]
MTDDHMNDQPNDAIQDERIRSLAAGHYNAPDGSVPRDAMWAQISAARRAARAGVAPIASVAPAATEVEETPADVVPLDSRRRTRTIVVWRWSAAVAAGLLLAFALGQKYGQLTNTTSPVGPVEIAHGPTPSPSAIEPPKGAPEGVSSSPAPNGTPTRTPQPQQLATRPSTDRSTPGASTEVASADSAASALYRAAAVQTLVQAEAVLTAYRGAESSTRDPQAMQQAARWARDVLSSTRLLIDSPAGRDPQMRSLFTDLELVLAQIVQLSGTPLQDSERDLIDRAMRDRDLLPRLRSAVPAGSATS